MNPTTKQPSAKAKPTSKPTAGKPESAAKASPAKAPPDNLAVKPTPAKAPPPRKAGGPDGPGVIGSIAEFLKSASAKQPLTNRRF